MSLATVTLFAQYVGRHKKILTVRHTAPQVPVPVIRHWARAAAQSTGTCICTSILYYVSKYVTAERPARSGQARASRRTQTAPHTSGHAPQMPRSFPTARAQPISPCISASLGLQRVPAAPSGATLPPTAYLAASIARALS